MQIYTLEQETRGLCPYDDKRYLLADLHDGIPNPNTHAYGHHKLATEVRIQIDMPERSGAELVLEQQQPPTNDEPYHTSLQVVKRELQFKRRHDRVAKTLAKRGRRDSNGEKSEAMSTIRCLTVMRTVSLMAPNFAKQNAPSQPVREQLLGSKMLSSRSATVIISACPTLHRNQCHHQVCNEPVRALTN